MSREKIAIADDVATTVRRCVAEVLDIPEGRIGSDSTLLDLGADSVSFMDLMFRLQQAYKIKLPRELGLPGDFTVNTYAEAIVSAVNG